MERLTKRWGAQPYPNLAGKVICEYKECDSTRSCENCIHGRYKDRLAAIEDILGEEYDLERLRELAKAEREGKIPKYTIGEMIYDKFGKFWTVDTIELHSLYTKNEWLYRCGHDGTDDYCALWEFESFPSKEAALRREQE